MRRGVGLTLLAAALSVVVSSCGNGVIDKNTDGIPPAEATGTLRVLLPSFPPSTKGREEFQKVVDDFQKTYPKMKVEPDFATYNNLNETLSTSIAAGIPYDVMVTGVGWIQPFASKRIFEDLAKYGLTPDVIKEKSTAALIPAVTYDGKLYGYPLIADTRAVALRKSAFREAGLDPDKPPTSLADIKVAAEKLTKRDKNGNITRSGFDLASATGFRQSFTTFLSSTGTPLYVGGEPNFNNKAGLDTLLWIKSMINVQPYGQTNAAQQPLVLTGEAAMGIVGGAVDCSDKGIGQKNCDDLKFFRFNSGKEIEYVGGDLASIGSRSRHKDAAWSFIQSLTKPTTLDALAKLNKKVPAYKDSANSPQAKSNPLSQFVADGLVYAANENEVPSNWLEMRGNFDIQLTQAVLGQKDPAKVLANLAGQSR